jgi:hypothetical protein
MTGNAPEPSDRAEPPVTMAQRLKQNRRAGYFLVITIALVAGALVAVALAF